MPVKAAPAAIVSPEEEAASQLQLEEDSPVFNIRPLLMNAPKTKKNFRFTADAADDQQQQQFKRSLSNAQLFQ